MEQVDRHRQSGGSHHLLTSDRQKEQNTQSGRECLLVNTPNAFQVANIEYVLCPQITGMRRFDFSTRLVVTGSTFQRFQALFEVLKVMAKPNRTDTASGDKDSLFT